MIPGLEVYILDIECILLFYFYCNVEAFQSIKGQT